MSTISQSKYDSIIIGSGSGGLTTGICLARAGQKTLILEQHYVPGGWCHSFMLNGQRFSPGVHYIGGLNESGSTKKMYEGIGLSEEVVFFQMNPDGFEHVRIGDLHFDYPSNPKELEAALIERFPEEEKGIKRYLKILATIEKQMFEMATKRTLIGNVWVILKSPTLLRFGLRTLQFVIDKYIKSKDLKAILNIQYGDHGVRPERASFAYHSGVMGHYAHGGYFPMGGGSALVKAMTNVYQAHGGEIRTSQKVERIILENGKAVGVELETGEKIMAERVVSNADPHATFTKLLDKDKLSGKLQKRLENLNYSVTSLSLFLTVEMDVRAAGIDSGNYWMSDTNDLNSVMKFENVEELTEGHHFDSVFFSCSTLKDPASNDNRYYNFEMITFLDNDVFTGFEGKDSSDTDYQEFKKKVSEKFLNSLETVLPGAKEAVVQMEIGTPNTNKFYINATAGNVYGTEKTSSQIGGNAFMAKTEIANLYMCGSSTLCHGVAGAAQSGLMCAAEILACSREDLLWESEGSITVINAEAPETWPDWLNDKIALRVKKSKSINPSEFLEHEDPFHKRKSKVGKDAAESSVPEQRA